MPDTDNLHPIWAKVLGISPKAEAPTSTTLDKPPAKSGIIETTPTNLFGNLTPLAKIVEPMRNRMAEYDHAVHALAVARERLRDLADARPPDMTLTVQREIAVAMGNPETLAKFDAENGEAMKAERETREAALRDREELPARILALENVVRQIAKRMRAGESVFDLERATIEVFEPYAQRLVEAAKHYADVMQEAVPGKKRSYKPIMTWSLQ